MKWYLELYFTWGDSSIHRIRLAKMSIRLKRTQFCWKMLCFQQLIQLNLVIAVENTLTRANSFNLSDPAVVVGTKTLTSKWGKIEPEIQIWWLWSFIQSYWAVQSGAVAQDGFWPDIAHWTSSPTVALHWNTIPAVLPQLGPGSRPRCPHHHHHHTSTPKLLSQCL